MTKMVIVMVGHYIECREGYDRLLDMESFGGQIRDLNDD